MILNLSTHLLYVRSQIFLFLCWHFYVAECGPDNWHLIAISVVEKGRKNTGYTATRKCQDTCKPKAVFRSSNYTLFMWLIDSSLISMLAAYRTSGVLKSSCTQASAIYYHSKPEFRPVVPYVWYDVIDLGKTCSCSCAVISSDVKTRWQPCEDCLAVVVMLSLLISKQDGSRAKIVF